MIVQMRDENDENDAHYGTTGINLSEPERVASLIGGAALAAYTVLRHNGQSIPAFLGSAFLLYRGVTGHCPVYEQFHINNAVTGLSQNVSVPHEQGFKIDYTINVNRPPSEVYAFWRQFDNLPRFMKHLDSVEVLDNMRSHWVANAPAGTKVQWDAEIINDIENKLIGWHSVEGSTINNAGSVRFSPTSDGQGTDVRVELKYDLPAGAIGATIARIFGKEPSQQIVEDLERFKQVMESGEVSPVDEDNTLSWSPTGD